LRHGGEMPGQFWGLGSSAAHAARWMWNLYHWWVGRVALLAAFANALVGFVLAQLPAWYSWGLALIWATIWLAAGAKMALNARRRRRAAGLGSIEDPRAQQEPGQFMTAGGKASGEP